MEESLYAELLRALKAKRVPVFIDWTTDRRELREMLASAQKFQWVGLGILAAAAVIWCFIPLLFAVKVGGLLALLALAVAIVQRTVHVGASVKTLLAKSEETLGDYTPAAILIVTFGDALADWVFYAAVIRGRSAWYTTLIQRPDISAAVGESLAGKSSVAVHVVMEFIADPNTFGVTTANEYVVRAARALEVSLPAFNPVEQTGSFLRGEH